MRLFAAFGGGAHVGARSLAVLFFFVWCESVSEQLTVCRASSRLFSPIFSPMASPTTLCLSRLLPAPLACGSRLARRAADGQGGRDGSQRRPHQQARQQQCRLRRRPSRACARHR
eukprot:3368588-Pleurochrysis_carterae.AAC.5